jgi:hypothetical protein
MNQLNRENAEFRGQHPIERGWIPAPLQMAQHNRSGLAVEPPGKLSRNDLANPAEFDLFTRTSCRHAHKVAAGQAGPFRHNHQGMPPASGLTVGNLAADMIKTPANLRQQNDVGTTCDTGMQGNPSGMATHHLQHHDSLMASCRGAEPIKRIGGSRHGRVKPKGERCGSQIIVDGLGHTDHRNAMAMKLLGNCQ